MRLGLIFSISVALCIIIYTYFSAYMNNGEEAYKKYLNLIIQDKIAADNKMLIEFVRNFILHPPSKQPYRTKSNVSYMGAKNGLSWYVINQYLEKLFRDQPSGFFIEAGALDGEILSNTLWLEKERGWTGLLVEPDESSYNELRKKNRKVWIANACLSTSPYPKYSYFRSFRPSVSDPYINDRYWYYRGISHGTDTFNASSVQDIFDLYNYHYSHILCLPPQSFLLALNVSVVDFFSLDTEGEEWEILKLFPWSSVKLRTVVVEYKSSQKLQAFLSYMDDKGYKLIGTSGKFQDYFFVLQNETALLRKLEYSKEF